MIKTDEYVKDGDGEGSMKATGQITEERIKIEMLTKVLMFKAEE